MVMTLADFDSSFWITCSRRAPAGWRGKLPQENVQCQPLRCFRHCSRRMRHTTSNSEASFRCSFSGSVTSATAGGSPRLSRPARRRAAVSDDRKGRASIKRCGERREGEEKLFAFTVREKGGNAARPRGGAIATRRVLPSLRARRARSLQAGGEGTGAAQVDAPVQRMEGAGANAESGEHHRAHQLANAAARGHLEVVRSLLASGADPNAVNLFGRTPIQVGHSGRMWGGRGEASPEVRARAVQLRLQAYTLSWE